MLELAAIIWGKVLALTIGLMFFRQLTPPFRLAMLQVFLGMMAEVMGRYIVVRYHEHNLWLFNYYWLAELWVMGPAGILLLKNIRLRAAFTLLLLIPSLIWLVLVYRNGIDAHPSPALTAIATALVVIFITVLLQLSFNTEKLATQPVFWLCLSVLVFFGGNLPYYSMFSYMYEHNPVLLGKLFVITQILNQLRYPMVGFAFYLAGREQLAEVKSRNNVR